MNLIKQYIVQGISAASNSLRLTTQKIEVVAMLRDFISKSEDLETDIKNMKAITELSKLGIRLNEIHNYLTNSQVNFLKLTDKFKEHSQFLIKDLNSMLENVDPIKFNELCDRVKSKTQQAQETNEPVLKSEEKLEKEKEIAITLAEKKKEEEKYNKSESEKLKEEIILDEEKEDEDLFFQNYENEILKPIKPLDSLLKKLSNDEFDMNELIEFAGIMQQNGDKSAKIGFEIIGNMHKIVAKALILIQRRELMPGREIIEAMRACLIVIVAVVKGKEVDITSYLNRAEEFGRKLQTVKIREY